MSQEISQPDSKAEFSLDAILYQFLTLYERWSEDRQAGAKQGAEVAKLIERFTEEVNNFKNLESNVRQQLVNRIQDSIISVGKTVGEQASLAATKEVKNAVDRLQDAVAKSEEIIRTYQTETVMTQWKVIGVSVFTCIVTCLLLVWWLIPSPTQPLTNEQLSFLEGGRVMHQKVWRKLTKKEQERYLKLAQ